MSKGAYEMLLQANGHLQEGRKDEAIRAYREVLRMNPTPPQRQVAEAQLRELGELPMTFASSGKVIRRQGPPPTEPGVGNKPNRRASLAPVVEHRSPRPGGTDKRGGAPGSGGFSRKPAAEREDQPLPAPSPSALRAASTSSSGNLPTAWASRPPSPTPASQPPMTRSERLLSVLDTMFKPKPREIPPPHDPRPPRPRERERDRDPRRPRGSKPAQAPKAKEAKAPHPLGIPPPPKRRTKESDTDFARRLARYEIWQTIHQANPSVDINVAEILHTKNLSLEDFRQEQEARRKVHKDKRKLFHEGLKQKNTEFEGTKFLESLIAKKSPLWLWGRADYEERAILTENRIYYAILRTVKGRKKRVHKLDLQLLCEKDVRSAVGGLIRIDEAQALHFRELPRSPQARLSFPETLFEDSWEEETPLYIHLCNGAWLRGYVAWYDPYQFGLVLLPDGAEPSAEPKIEVMIFRHALLKLQTEAPASWAQMPTLLNWKAKHNG